MTRLLLIGLLVATLFGGSIAPVQAASTCETIRQSQPTSADPLAPMFGCRSVKAYKWVAAPGYCNRQARKLALQYASNGEVVIRNYLENGCLFDSASFTYVRQ
jgi:hypothetical protein